MTRRARTEEEPEMRTLTRHDLRRVVGGVAEPDVPLVPAVDDEVELGTTGQPQQLK